MLSLVLRTETDLGNMGFDPLPSLPHFTSEFGWDRCVWVLVLCSPLLFRMGSLCKLSCSTGLLLLPEGCWEAALIYLMLLEMGIVD